MPHAPGSPADLPARLAGRWRARPADLALTLDGRPLTGADLLSLAGRYAAGLAARDVGPGDRVGLVLGTGEAFVGAFFGAWWLGAVPVPLAPPRAFEEAELVRVGRALAIAGARLALIPDGVPPTGSGHPCPSPAFAHPWASPPLAPCPLVPAGEIPLDPPLAGPMAPLDLAALQFSSGSTGHPKGVALPLAALTANLAGLVEALSAGPHDRGCAWLPLHHDMGLVGTLLFPLYAGFEAHLIPPERFIREPARWITELGRLGATITTGPTFGYALAARLPASATEGLDLSRLRAALVGAEPVHLATLDAFATRYAPHGFRRTALTPTYGLAEATLAVTLTPTGEGPGVDRVDRAALEREHAAVPAAADDASARAVMAVGEPLPGVAVAIRDEAGVDLPERRAGEVWVRSPGLMRGYWEDPAATAAALTPEGWLRTGDLGYMTGGRLHVCGRLKDVIVRAGRKYHAADLEALVEAVPGVRAGGTAAFAVDAAGDRPERVVMLVEPRADAADAAAVLAAVRRHVMAAVGLRLDEVVAVAPRSLPRTTSGKLQRGLARARWRQGLLSGPEAPGG